MPCRSQACLGTAGQHCLGGLFIYSAHATDIFMDIARGRSSPGSGQAAACNAGTVLVAWIAGIHPSKQGLRAVPRKCSGVYN